MWVEGLMREEWMVRREVSLQDSKGILSGRVEFDMEGIGEFLQGFIEQGLGLGIIVMVEFFGCGEGIRKV